MGPHCITFVVLYIKGDCEGTDLERAIARESIWRRSLRGNRSNLVFYNLPFYSEIATPHAGPRNGRTGKGVVFQIGL